MSNDFQGKMPGSLNHPEELEEYIQVTTPPSGSSSSTMGRSLRMEPTRS